MSAEQRKGDPAAPVARVHKPAFGAGLLASKPPRQRGTIFTNLLSLTLHVVLLGALVQSTVGNQVVTQEDEVTVMELTQELEAPPPPPPPPVDAPPPAADVSLEFTVPDVIPAEIPPPGAVAITAENIYQDMLQAAQDTSADNRDAVVAIGETPSFTPCTVAPVVQNRDEVARALEREYPALLRDAGVGGRAIVWIRLDETGTVRDVQINTSSGQPSLDEAALKVGQIMKFSPAMNRDKVVPVWVSIPVSFQVR
jgi:protein TonB